MKIMYALLISFKGAERSVTLCIFVIPMGKTTTNQSIVPTADITRVHGLDGYLSDGWRRFSL